MGFPTPVLFFMVGLLYHAPMKKIYIGSDHAGFEMKAVLLMYLGEKGFAVEDMGTHSTESVDYVDVVPTVCEKVLGDVESYGILICGTGIGMQMAANRMKGIRATVAVSEFMARMARQHNHANVLCLGGRMIGMELAKSLVDTFLTTEMEQSERHARRIEKMDSFC